MLADKSKARIAAFASVYQGALNAELGRPGMVAALTLFADGATVPFVARYRRGATNSADAAQLQVSHRVLGRSPCSRTTG